VELAQDWEARAAAVLAVGKDGARLSATPSVELAALLRSGEALRVRLGALPQLGDVMRAHDKWEGLVAEIMKSGEAARAARLHGQAARSEAGRQGRGAACPAALGALACCRAPLAHLQPPPPTTWAPPSLLPRAAGPRPPYAELARAAAAARGSPVTSALRAQVDGAVAGAEAWLERARRSVARRNSGVTLDRALELLARSVDNAVEQFERRLEVRLCRCGLLCTVCMLCARCLQLPPCCVPVCAG
jgi:hypothetical protein